MRFIVINNLIALILSEYDLNVKKVKCNAQLNIRSGSITNNNKVLIYSASFELWATVFYLHLLFVYSTQFIAYNASFINKLDKESNLKAQFKLLTSNSCNEKKT